MNSSLKIFLFFILLLQFVLIINTIKAKRMSMRYGSFWLFILVLMFVAVLFPGIFTSISSFFGFEATSNMIFLIGFFFLFYIIFVLTMSLSRQQATIKILIQEISLLKAQSQIHENERK